MDRKRQKNKADVEDRGDRRIIAWAENPPRWLHEVMCNLYRLTEISGRRVLIKSSRNFFFLKELKAAGQMNWRGRHSPGD